MARETQSFKLFFYVYQIAFMPHTLIVQSSVVPERHKVSCSEQASVIVDFMCQLD